MWVACWQPRVFQRDSLCSVAVRVCLIININSFDLRHQTWPEVEIRTDAMRLKSGVPSVSSLSESQQSVKLDG